MQLDLTESNARESSGRGARLSFVIARRSPVPFFVLVLLAGGSAACARPGDAPTPAPGAPSVAVATVDAAVATADAAVAAVDAAPPPSVLPPKLRLTGRERKDGTMECTLTDEETGAVVGRATSQQTAAGGSNVECHDHIAGGKIIRLRNSRGIYAKDARPGPTNDRGLRCGDGVFASDVSSCVELDTAPQVFSGIERTEPDAPFDVSLCAVGGAPCRKLVTIRRGLNRIGPRPVPRWWDARYCGDDRVLVVAEGELRLFEAPSGKLLASAAAPHATSLVSCEGGVARTSDPRATELRSFAITATTIKVVPPPSDAPTK